ncbi:MAG: LON peptidase substrate-binding domain-containing protein [Parvibaculales bacterium]
MKEKKHDINIDNLPQSLAVFPLEGGLLLPRGQLPLNIFEPIYLQLVEDVFGRGRYMGIIQPSFDKDDGLQQIGCLGRITSFTQSDDERFLINVTGIARFRVGKMLEVTTPYLQLQPDYRPFSDDLIADVGAIDVNRDGLIEVLRNYLDRNGMSADWEAIEQSGNEALVNSLSMISPYGPQEKQALLEAESLAQRAEILIALTEMVLADMARAAGSNDNRLQ